MLYPLTLVRKKPRRFTIPDIYFCKQIRVVSLNFGFRHFKKSNDFESEIG